MARHKKFKDDVPNPDIAPEANEPTVSSSFGDQAKALPPRPGNRVKITMPGDPDDGRMGKIINVYPRKGIASVALDPHVSDGLRKGQRIHPETKRIHMIFHYTEFTVITRSIFTA